MRTSKPFSSISYNSTAYLQSKLKELTDGGKLRFATFIEHFREDDEKKVHKHIFFIPDGVIDTNALLKELDEVDLKNPGQLLKCMPCQSSKFGDWYLYAIHDSAYLGSKGQSRKYHYKQEDLFSTDSDYLNELIHTIDYSKTEKIKQFYEQVKEGKRLSELVQQGLIPIQQFLQYQRLYDMIVGESTYRNGNPNHEEIDPKTGEVIKK